MIDAIIVRKLHIPTSSRSHYMARSPYLGRGVCGDTEAEARRKALDMEASACRYGSAMCGVPVAYGGWKPE